MAEEARPVNPDSHFLRMMAHYLPQESMPPEWKELLKQWAPWPTKEQPDNEDKIASSELVTEEKNDGG